MKKKKILIPILALLILGGGAYKTVLAKPAPKEKPKVEGTIYVLGSSFLVNLKQGRFAKLTAGLLLKPGALPPAKEGVTAKLEQEPLVRSVITDDLTDATDQQLISAKGRKSLQRKILKDIKATTDVKATDVFFTDVTVQ
jgi:flagellar basal body-associated protein FliL